MTTHRTGSDAVTLSRWSQADRPTSALCDLPSSTEWLTTRVPYVARSPARADDRQHPKSAVISGDAIAYYGVRRCRRQQNYKFASYEHLLMDAIELRRLGVELLEPLFKSHGFVYEAGVADRGSGGLFAQGAFVRDDHRFEFSTRYSVGDVVYRVGGEVLSHEDFMRVAAGRGRHRYPGFSDDPLDGFRDIAADLAAFGGVFLRGASSEFTVVAAEAQRTRPLRGLSALSRQPAS